MSLFAKIFFSLAVVVGVAGVLGSGDGSGEWKKWLVASLGLFLIAIIVDIDDVNRKD